jgi:hypothetical protein
MACSCCDQRRRDISPGELYPETNKVWNTLLFSQPPEMHTLGGNSCIMEKSLMAGGGSFHSDTEFGVCEKMTREASDSDCLLPTNIFKEILISRPLNHW